MVLVRSLKILVNHIRLYVLVVILTNGSCKIFKDSCINHIQDYFFVLVVMLTNGSRKIFNDSCMNHI